MKVSKDLIKKWGVYFWCPVFQQQVQLAQCCWRFCHREEFPTHEPCRKCLIRRVSLKRLRLPRVAKRTPRLA